MAEATATTQTPAAKSNGADVASKAPPAANKPAAAGEPKAGAEKQPAADQAKKDVAGKNETAEQRAARGRMQIDAVNLAKQRQREQRIREDAEAATRFRELQDLSKKDREAFLKQMGIDPHGFALDWLEKQGAERVAPTTDKRVEELEAKLKEYDERWRKREESDQQRTQQEQTTQAQKLVKDLVGDAKHGERWEAINAQEAWESVRQAAIAYTQREGLSIGSREELEEVLSIAADAVEEELVEQAKKLSTLKKLGLKKEEAEAEMDNKEDKKESLHKDDPVDNSWQEKLTEGQRKKLDAMRARNKALGSKGLKPAPASGEDAPKPMLTQAEKIREFIARHNLKR